MIIDAGAAAPAAARRPGRVRWLLARLHDWAESGWAGPATGAWGAMQSSVVPGPADALLIPLGIADPPRVWRLALWATVGTVIGGVIAWGIGHWSFDDLGRPLLALVGLEGARLARLRSTFEDHGWMLVVLSAVSPLPTKATCIAAGAFGVPFGEFLPAIAVGRAMRFAVLAGIVHAAGERLEHWLRRGNGSARVDSMTR